MSPSVNVLWTSGWDSTYRVADLVLKQGRTVQPWYVMDSARRSTKTELRALENIRAALVQIDPGVEALLGRLKTVRIEDIPADGGITASYKALAAQNHLGSQYDWLARFAKSESVYLELSIHRDDKAHAFLEGHTHAASDGVHHLVEDAPSDVSIFKWFSFPLFEMSKLEMQQTARERGFGQIMEMTWFCFVPLLDGRPCGFCNPCKYTREEGLGRRVPEPTKMRKAQYLIFFNLIRARQTFRTRLSSLS